jgi:hypothetical protein
VGYVRAGEGKGGGIEGRCGGVGEVLKEMEVDGGIKDAFLESP